MLLALRITNRICSPAMQITLESSFKILSSDSTKEGKVLKKTVLEHEWFSLIRSTGVTSLNILSVQNFEGRDQHCRCSKLEKPENWSQLIFRMN